MNGAVNGLVIKTPNKAANLFHRVLDEPFLLRVENGSGACGSVAVERRRIRMHSSNEYRPPTGESNICLCYMSGEMLGSMKGLKQGRTKLGGIAEALPVTPLSAAVSRVRRICVRLSRDRGIRAVARMPHCEHRALQWLVIWMTSWAGMRLRLNERMFLISRATMAINAAFGFIRYCFIA